MASFFNAHCARTAPMHSAQRCAGRWQCAGDGAS